MLAAIPSLSSRVYHIFLVYPQTISKCDSVNNGRLSTHSDIARNEVGNNLSRRR